MVAGALESWVGAFSVICVGIISFGAGSLNRGCRSKNGQIIGVIHERWCVDGGGDDQIPNMIICKGNDLDERKRKLMDHGDCLIVLPGGVGTFDELWDVVSSRSLGFKDLTGKPICLVNTDGFYDGFITQIQRASQEGLLYGTVDSYFHVCDDPKSALDWCIANVSKKDVNKEIDELGRESRMSLRGGSGQQIQVNLFVSFALGLLVGGGVAYLRHRGR